MSTAVASVATAAPPAAPSAPASDAPEGRRARPIPPKPSGQAAVDAVLSKGSPGEGGGSSLSAVFGSVPQKTVTSKETPGSAPDSAAATESATVGDQGSSQSPETDTRLEAQARDAAADAEGDAGLVEVKFRSGKLFRVPPEVKAAIESMAGRQSADTRRLAEVEGRERQYREASQRWEQSFNALSARIKELEAGGQQVAQEKPGSSDDPILDMVADIDFSRLPPDTTPDQQLKYALYELARRMKSDLTREFEAKVGDKVKPFEEERSIQQKIAAFRGDLVHLGTIMDPKGDPAFPELQDTHVVRDIVDNIMNKFQCEHDRVGMYKAILIYRDTQARKAEAAAQASALPDAPEPPDRGAASVGLADSGGIPDAARNPRKPENDALNILTQRRKRPAGEQSLAGVFGL